MSDSLTSLLLAYGFQPDSDVIREVAALRERAERQQIALDKINAIRNSIVGFQTVNFSEHVYPLVAALDECGIEGEGYEVARDKGRTLLQRIADLEAERAALMEAGKAVSRWWAGEKEFEEISAANDVFDEQPGALAAWMSREGSPT